MASEWHRIQQLKSRAARIRSCEDVLLKYIKMSGTFANMLLEMEQKSLPSLCSAKTKLSEMLSSSGSIAPLRIAYQARANQWKKPREHVRFVYLLRR